MQVSCGFMQARAQANELMHLARSMQTSIQQVLTLRLLSCSCVIGILKPLQNTARTHTRMRARRNVSLVPRTPTLSCIPCPRIPSFSHPWNLQNSCALQRYTRQTMAVPLDSRAMRLRSAIALSSISAKNSRSISLRAGRCRWHGAGLMLLDQASHGSIDELEVLSCLHSCGLTTAVQSLPRWPLDAHFGRLCFVMNIHINAGHWHLSWTS